MPLQTNRAGAGVREVLGCALPSDGSGLARALLIGTRIDTRNLPNFIEPEAMAVAGLGAAFVFRYGVLVVIGASRQAEARLLAELADHVIEPLDQPEIEIASIEISGEGDEAVSADGHIRLHEASTQRLLLTATVLARSVLLGRDEAEVTDAFDRLEPLINDLRTSGRARLPIRQVMKNIGGVLSAQHRVVGGAQIGEKPDLLWDHPELDRLYGRLESEFELSDRARAVERKLEMIGDAAEWLLDLVQDKRSLRLELSVIALIAFEVLLNVWEFWFR